MGPRRADPKKELALLRKRRRLEQDDEQQLQKEQVLKEQILERKIHSHLKNIHRSLKKAKQFEVRKLMRRLKTARDKEGGASKGGAAPMDQGDSGKLITKLEMQLAAAKEADLNYLVGQAGRQCGVEEKHLPKDGAQARSATKGKGAAPGKGAAALQGGGEVLAATVVLTGRLLGSQVVQQVMAGLRETLEDPDKDGTGKAAGVPRGGCADAAVADGDEGGMGDDELSDAVEVRKKRKGVAQGRVDPPSTLEDAAFADAVLEKLRKTRTDDPGEDAMDDDDDDDSGVIEDSPLPSDVPNDVSDMSFGEGGSEDGSGDGESDEEPSGVLAKGAAGGGGGGGGGGGESKKKGRGKGEAPAKAKKKEQPKKKRMGQRARRLLAEQKFGQGAKHLAEAAAGGGAAATAGWGGGGGKLHPSWEAKRQQALAASWEAKQRQAKMMSLVPAGKKVVFGDD